MPLRIVSLPPVDGGAFVDIFDTEVPVEFWDAQLLLSRDEGARTLSTRERADRLYALGEFAAAAELLPQ